MVRIALVIILLLAGAQSSLASELIDNQSDKTSNPNKGAKKVRVAAAPTRESGSTSNQNQFGPDRSFFKGYTDKQVGDFNASLLM